MIKKKKKILNNPKATLGVRDDDSELRDDDSHWRPGRREAADTDSTFLKKISKTRSDGLE